MRRWPAWLVRTIIFGGLGLLLIIAIGGRVRADRALHRADQVADMGTPGVVAARAQQMMSVWAGEPAVVIKVEREGHQWRAMATVGGDCYQMAVADKVSAHPGLIPCPPVTAAGSSADRLSTNDPRAVVVSGLLGAWLTGDSTADRYLADERPALGVPSRYASDVKVTATYGPDLPAEPGAHSLVTADATVTFVDKVEDLAWTFDLVHGDNRWSIAQVVGGETPTGDAATLIQGRNIPEKAPGD